MDNPEEDTPFSSELKKFTDDGSLHLRESTFSIEMLESKKKKRNVRIFQENAVAYVKEER